MFEAEFDDKKRRDSKKEKRKYNNSDGINIARLDAESVKELGGWFVVTVNFIAFEFTSVESENRQKASVKTMLKKRTIEEPVPKMMRVFHQDKKSREQREKKYSARGDDQR